MRGGTGAAGGGRGGSGASDGQAGPAGLDEAAVEVMIAAALAEAPAGLNEAAVLALIAANAAPKPFVAYSTPIPSQGWPRMAFTGLNGDLHKRYRVTAQFKITGTSGLLVYINDKTNMTAWWSKVQTSATAVAFSSGGAISEIGKAGAIVSLTMDVLAARFNTTNRAGRVFTGTLTVQQTDNNTTVHNYKFFGPFLYPTENITQIDIASSDGFDLGAVGRIEQVFV